MQQTQTLTVLTEDYKKILSWLRDGHLLNAMDSRLIHQLKEELQKARQVNREEMPADVVRLYSTVTVLEQGKNDPVTFTIVPPGHASIPEKKVSLLAPMATALFGYRTGDRVEWEVPSGWKTFIIQQVVNAD